MTKIQHIDYLKEMLKFRHGQISKFIVDPAQINRQDGCTGIVQLTWRVA